MGRKDVGCEGGTGHPRLARECFSRCIARTQSRDKERPRTKDRRLQREIKFVVLKPAILNGKSVENTLPEIIFGVSHPFISFQLLSKELKIRNRKSIYWYKINSIKGHQYSDYLKTYLYTFIDYFCKKFLFVIPNIPHKLLYIKQFKSLTLIYNLISKMFFYNDYNLKVESSHIF